MSAGSGKLGVWVRALRGGAGLLFVAITSSCILNPQPEPPSRGPNTSQVGGAGGASGSGFGGSSAGQGGTGRGGSAGASGVGGFSGVGGNSGSGTGGTGADPGIGGTGGSGGFGGVAGAGGAGGSGGGGGTGGTSGGAPCRQALDCASGTTCFADRGTCDPIPPPDCHLPSDEGGTGQRFAPCSPAAPCGKGLTCVATAQILGPSGTYEAAETGVCLAGCNPCAPAACANGETCFGRESEGGFCSPALLPEGAPCGSVQAPSPCAAGLTCNELTAFAGKTCLRHCRPDAAAPDPGSHEAHSATSSADCRPNELCFETASSSSSSSTSPSVFACVPGTPVEAFGLCGGDRYCRPPATCMLGVCAP